MTQELVAQALHFNSPRKDNRFVTINCSAIPETLIESEFFGHEKGAFTGADSRKIGKFQYADGGTLFLDEVGELSLAMQVKLLRVLQERRFTPVGSTREIKTNARIVAATNRNLEKAIEDGSFREDLFYRLNVMPIFLPPLRERREDIPALIDYFCKKFARRHGREVLTVDPAAMQVLVNHPWPGNIRELEHTLERVVTLESGQTIEKHFLPLEVIIEELGNKASNSAIDLKKALREFEKELVEKAFMLAKGNQTLAAKYLGVNRTTLINKIQLLDLKFDEETSA
jgi:transcriptional regulator with PAS, ATPase and Fis domain